MKTNKKLFILLMAILSFIIVLLTLKSILRHFIYKNDYMSIITENTSNFMVDPYMILSIIKTESNFNSNAVSKKNAYGLMQILLTTANEVNEELKLCDDIDSFSILDERKNITIGSKYFSDLILKFNGNYYLAIIAYNAGIGNVNKWIDQKIINYDFKYENIEKIPYVETKNYLRKVLFNYKMYKILY